MALELVSGPAFRRKKNCRTCATRLKGSPGPEKPEKTGKIRAPAPQEVPSRDSKPPAEVQPRKPGSRIGPDIGGVSPCPSEQRERQKRARGALGRPVDHPFKTTSRAPGLFCSLFCLLLLFSFFSPGTALLGENIPHRTTRPPDRAKRAPGPPQIVHRNRRFSGGTKELAPEPDPQSLARLRSDETRSELGEREHG